MSDVIDPQENQTGAARTHDAVFLFALLGAMGSGEFHGRTQRAFRGTPEFKAAFQCAALAGIPDNETALRSAFTHAFLTALESRDI